MTNPIIDAIVRLELWLTAGVPPNPFVFKRDVRLLVDTVRDVEGLAFDLEQLEAKYRELRAEVDALRVVRP